jgi:hypothetical protein
MVASDLVAASQIGQCRLLPQAQFAGPGAARMETAARWQVLRAREIAAQRCYLPVADGSGTASIKAWV